MVKGDRIAEMVLRFDRRLEGIERESLQRLYKAMNSTYKDLMEELRTQYRATKTDLVGQTDVYREARARAMVAQLKPLMNVTSQTPDVFPDLTIKSSQEAFEAAMEMLNLYEPHFELFSPSISELVAIQALNAKDRLAHWGQDFAIKAEQKIIQGILKGQGFRVTARQLREDVEITKRQAERIVKTETVAAGDAARKITYKEQGVEGEQLITVADDRVCKYCASRSGSVYRLGELVLPLHPFDRCYLAPWKKKWQDQGLTDVVWYRTHKTDSFNASGVPEDNGLAPLEKLRGLDKAPIPIWTAGEPPPRPVKVKTPAKTPAKSSPAPSPAPTESLRVFVPAKSAAEVKKRMEKFANTYQMKGLSLERQNEILEVTEDVFSRFPLSKRMDYFGFQRRRRQSYAYASYGWNPEDPFDVDFKKSYATKVPRVNQEMIDIYERNKSTKRARLESTLERLKDRPETDRAVTDTKDALEKLNAATRWSVESEYESSLAATTRHELYHIVDYEYGATPRKVWKVKSRVFERALKRNAVTELDKYRVSEYATTNLAELWAESNVAVDQGVSIPDSVRNAVLETRKELLENGNK